MSLGERVGWILTFCGAILGFLASVGVFLVPPLSASAVWWLAPLLFGMGTTGGLAARWRGREIDSCRWEIVADSELTSGEREYAHREAERDRRLSATAYLAGPLALGYWAAYQAGGTDSTIWVQLLPLAPLAGFGGGWVAGRRQSDEAAPTDL